MGLFSSIGNFISSAISTVSNFISDSATTILSGIAKCLPIMKEISIAVQIVSHTAKIVSELFNIIFGKEVNMEELGAKINQEGTRPQMESETTEDYINYLSENVELDKEKMEKSTLDEKFVNLSTGISLVSDSLNEKLGLNITGEFLVSIGKLNLNRNFVDNLLKNFIFHQQTNTDMFVSYLKNELENDDRTKMATILKDTIQNLDSTLTDKEIQTKIVDMKCDYNK